MANQIIDALQFNGSSADKYILSLPYCTCNTAADVSAKTVTLNNFILEPGVQIMVKFAYTNTAFYPTLNVNNTGAKNIRINNTSVPGSSLVSSNIYLFLYDGSAWNIVSGAVKKQCIVGQINNEATALAKPWYKVAYIKIDSAYNDRSITFRVNQVYGSASTNTGILTAHVRTNSSKVFETGELKWEYANSGVTPANFVLVHKSTANTCLEAEIWAKQLNPYTFYLFEVMFEGTRDAFGDFWTLYNQQTAGSQASLPSGWTQIASTLTAIKNKAETAAYADSAGTATSATTATNANKAKGMTVTALDLSAGKTIANLQTQLRTWLANNTNTPGACCTFVGALSDVMAKWSNTANTFTGGVTNTVHLETVYSADNYALLRFTSYANKEVYYAALVGGTWGPMYKAVFMDNSYGDVTIPGTLTLSRTQDASGKTAATPALIVGGTSTTAHLQMDANEIIAKTNGTTPGPLYINGEGGDVYVGSSATVATNLNVPNGEVKAKGGTFTGAVSSSVDKANGTAQFRNSIVASSVPSDLSALKVGDMIYVEGESSGGGSYTLPVATSSTLGGVKSGGDVSINSSTGVITVNDDSHNHVISNIDGLQTQLNTFTTEDRVLELISAYYPCLVEGTMIAMADGTEKPIEEIQPGDLIKSYNPITKTTTDAVAIKAYTTGANRTYTSYNFEDGRSLVVYEQHQIYDAAEGTTFDIRSINRNRRMINIDNEETLWAGKRVVVYHGKRKKRYNLLSSNNLYFANGLLLGNKPYEKLEYIEDWQKGVIDEEIRKIWEQDCDDYSEVTATPADAAVFMELKDVYKEYAEAQNQITIHKNLLNNSDYKSIKRSENLIGDEEWAEISTKRQKWRDVVNENQDKYTKLRQQIDDAWAARRPENWTGRSLFEGCFERDNAAFELVKAYFEEKNKTTE